MKENGHKKPHTKTGASTPDDLTTDQQRVNSTLNEMQNDARLQSLSDLELIAELLKDKDLSLDPRVYELMSRLYPDWHNEPSFDPPTKAPRFISFAVPFAVADAFATYNDCQCDQSFANEPSQNAPCIYCSCRKALFKSTQNAIYQS